MMTTEAMRAQIDPDFTIQLALTGDAEAIERIMDLELDALGIHRGYSASAAFWLRVAKYVS